MFYFHQECLRKYQRNNIENVLSWKTYYKADPSQFHNGDFDIIIENAADLDEDEADESD